MLSKFAKMGAEACSLPSLFAHRLLGENCDSKAAAFLGSLLREAKEGSLCLKSEEEFSWPPHVLGPGKDWPPKEPIIKDQNRYYLQRNWVVETHIFNQLKRLTSQQAHLHNRALFGELLEKKPLQALQKKAIEKAFDSSFFVLAGGPGTGKTYTAAVLAQIFQQCSHKPDYKIVVAAPTGKAASHLQSVLQMDIKAFTLHRLLRLLPGQNRLFSQKKIDADLIIVDEASMIDPMLFAHLLEAVPSEAKLIVMGDPNQLPPVGAGGIFHDLASLFGQFLERSMRVENDRLKELSSNIQSGEPISPEFFLELRFDETVAQKIFTQISPFMSFTPPDPEDCLKKLSQFRVLNALRNGPFGADRLNLEIVRIMEKRLRIGQWWAIPIMINANDPDTELYNGTCGVLVGQFKGKIDLFEAIAYFPEKIPSKKLPSFEIAFCLSVHKSQGSEFERVWAIFPKGSEKFGKEALYTAVTRAKKEVRLLSSPEIIQELLSKCSLKNTGLADRFSRS